MFRDRWECGHIGTVIFVVQAALLVPYIIIGVMGGGTALRGDHRWLRALLAGRGHRRARRDELRVPRRHAGHGRGQRVPDRALPVIRRRRARRHRPWHGRVSGGDGIAAGLARDRAAPDARAVLAPHLSQLHVHPALDHRLSAHHDLLPDGEADGAVPAHGHLLPALHPGDLAAVRVPRRRGQRHARRAAHREQARGPRRRSRRRRRR